ncbi:MAG: protein translocase subunit SecD [Clostridia bacterium]|nr:protein translocase subunit SecD [Clostridia bacterium]
MIKRKAKFKFALIITSIIIGLCLTIFSFNIPFTNYTYNGFVNSIKLGIDLKGGVLAVYNVVPDPESTSSFESEVEATITRLQSLITEKGYTEATVVRQTNGTDTQIRIEVPDVDDPAEIFSLIGQPAKLEFKTVKDVNAQAELTGDYIKSVEASYQDGDYGVSIEFDNEGAQIFFNLTTQLSENKDKLYLYIGGVLFSEPAVQSVISDGKTFISGSMNSYSEAEAYATKILSGTFSVQLELFENSVVSATLGKDALSMSLLAGIIGFSLVLIFMYLIYGTFGLLANLSLIIYIVILMFFLQAVPLVQLTLPGIAGIILSLGMAVDANVIIFERIKDEYRAGKKIPSSVKSGFEKSLSAILDGNITTIIASVVLYILGTGAIKGFAITLLIGIFVSMFTGLFITRKLISTYLPLNSTNPKPYKLKREATTNELS